MEIAIKVQIMKEAVCISHSANTRYSDNNSHTSYGQIVRLTVLFEHGMFTDQGKGNSEFKPVRLHLKTELESHLARGRGIG